MVQGVYADLSDAVHHRVLHELGRRRLAVDRRDLSQPLPLEDGRHVGHGEFPGQRLRSVLRGGHAQQLVLLDIRLLHGGQHIRSHVRRIF